MTDNFFHQLFNELKTKKNQDIETSWTAKLLSNKDLISKKIIEEAGEVVIELTKNNKEKIIYESSDLIYHIFVGLIANGIDLQDIENELKNRTKISGIEEKKSRK